VGTLGPVRPLDEVWYEAVLASAPAMARRARSAVASNLWAVLGEGPELETATLLVSEIVTNAMTHAGGPVTLTIGRKGPWVYVGVTDSHPEHRPKIREVTPEDVSGRGMVIVDSQAAAWGVDVAGDRKTVWFTLPHPA
jgi:hypothetical protein